MASRWADHLVVSPAYYPLYNVFWGSLEWFVHDAFAVTILHRVLIVLGTTALLLAVLRRLLTPGIAWALALWWATLPVTYDALYEIHLFGALAGLAIALVALRWSGLAGRAVTFGLLLASALLVRNEYVVAALVFGAIWLGYEIWRSRGQGTESWRGLAAAAALPLVALAALIGLASWRNADDSSVFTQLSRKHELALCQGYAQGLWDTGDELTQNPLGQCYLYMRRDFGESFPSVARAVADNPDAMAGHFGRNAELVPAGLEVGLFNEKFGSVTGGSNPDYIPVARGSWVVLAGSIAVLLVIVAGAALVWTDRRRWWGEWIRDRVWGWIVLVAMGSSALYAALYTRPRPSYIFPLTILILAALGMSLVALAGRLRVPKLAPAVIPALAVLALLLVPSHYRAGYSNPQTGPGQRLRIAVERLDPYREELQGDDDHGLLAVYPAFDACNYVGRTDPCRGVAWMPNSRAPLPQAALTTPNASTPTRVDLIYADEYVFRADPGMRAKLDGLVGHGWRLLAPSSPDSTWMLLERDAAASRL